MVAIPSEQVNSDSKFIENTYQESTESNGAIQSLSEQERIDTMVRAFKRLPAAELDRIGVDISAPIQSGSENAKHLFEAWKVRQAEFKKAVESMLAPVEHMKTIADRLQAYINTGMSGKESSMFSSPSSEKQGGVSNEASSPNILDVLTELESLLSDVDNARDFHTIGGWPLLVQQLTHTGGESDTERRALAAWCIGTAIKSNYDYQLWTLENISRNISDKVSSNIGDTNYSTADAIEAKNYTTISFLIETLDECAGGAVTSRGTDDLIKKSLYALSAAARGNMDVQEAVYHSQSSSGHSFMHIVTSLLLSNETSFDVKRKVWSLASDMLEERQFIRDDLLNSKQVAESPEVAEKVRKEIDSFHMLGDSFCTPSFAQLTLQSVSQFIRHSTYVPYFATLFSDSTSSAVGGEAVLPHNKLMSYRAILESALLVMREQALHCPSALLKPSTTPRDDGAMVDSSASEVLITAEVHQGRIKMTQFTESVLAPILAHSDLLPSNQSIDTLKEQSDSISLSTHVDTTGADGTAKVDEESEIEQEDTVLAHTLTPVQEMIQNSAMVVQALRNFLESSHRDCLLQGNC